MTPIPVRKLSSIILFAYSTHSCTITPICVVLTETTVTIMGVSGVLWTSWWLFAIDY